MDVLRADELECRDLELPLGIDAKGVHGVDGNTYFVDLGNCMPRDTTFDDVAAVHRPDLLANYRAAKVQEEVACVCPLSDD